MQHPEVRFLSYLVPPLDPGDGLVFRLRRERHRGHTFAPPFVSIASSTLGTAHRNMCGFCVRFSTRSHSALTKSFPFSLPRKCKLPRCSEFSEVRTNSHCGHSSSTLSATRKSPASTMFVLSTFALGNSMCSSSCSLRYPRYLVVHLWNHGHGLSVLAERFDLARKRCIDVVHLRPVFGL